MMKTAQELMQRTAVVAEAKSWLKTPYHHMASVKGGGVDCATLLTAVYEAVGLIPSIKLGYYSPHWNLHRNDEIYLQWLDEYAHVINKPEKGDVVIYKFGRTFAHGGIVVEWPLIIHSYSRSGMVCFTEGDIGEFVNREKLFYSLWGGK